MRLSEIHLRVCLLTSVALISACGTSSGNPSGGSGTTGEVTFKSAAYSASSARVLVAADPAAAFATAITELKFCVTKMKLKAEDGSAVGGDSVEAKLGLVDLSNPSAEATWGKASIPVGFNLQKLTVELHKDKDLCGGNEYSMLLNGKTLSKDLEFKFKFDPVVSVNIGDTLKLAMDTIATALVSAYDAGKFSDESIGEYLKDTTEGKGSK